MDVASAENSSSTKTDDDKSDSEKSYNKTSCEVADEEKGDCEEADDKKIDFKEADELCINTEKENKEIEKIPNIILNQHNSKSTESERIENSEEENSNHDKLEHIVSSDSKDEHSESKILKITEEINSQDVESKNTLDNIAEGPAEKFDSNLSQPVSVEYKHNENMKTEEKEKSTNLNVCNNLDSEQSSITVIRSMIHCSEVIDLDDSLSDFANSSSEGFSLMSDKSRNTSLNSSPIKGYNTCQEDGDSAFSVGSRVEVKDFAEMWHPALIVEVDSDEMEVLLRYESYHTQKNDEWISVSSPRIRAYTGLINTTKTLEANKVPTLQRKQFKQEQDQFNEPQVQMVEYKAGERCFAKWSDNRRFPATVQSVLGDGKYEILFDDGICRVCQWYYLSKMKKKKLAAATSTSTSLRSVGFANDPQAHTSGISPVAPPVPYHRHLFDPQLDYLGSKSERRAMKKKLDVKALFNIGKRNTPRILKRKPAVTNEGPPAKKTQVAGKTTVLEIKDTVPEIKAVIPEIKEEFTEPSCSEVKQETKPIDVINNEVNDSVKSEEEIKSDIMKVESMNEISTKIRKSTGKKLKLKLTNEVKVTIDDVEEPVKESNEEVEKVFTNEVESKPDAVITSGENELLESNIDCSIENITVDNKDNIVDIDEGLKLVAQAVASFECDTEPTECKEIETKLEQTVAPIQMKKEEPIPERYEATLRDCEWCCKWVDGEPQGVVVDNETDTPSKGDQPSLPRKSVWVEDKRLPAGWKKILVRRCYGNSAGKWDVVLIDPNNRRLRDKGEMRNYISLNTGDDLKAFEHILMDFSVHRKLARQMGWDITTSGGARLSVPVASPVKVKLPAAKKRAPGVDDAVKKKKKRPAPLPPVVSVLSALPAEVDRGTPSSVPLVATPSSAPVTATQLLPDYALTPMTPVFDGLPLIDGCVYVGSMKVQILENLFRCPADGCYKNFRKVNLLRMHIKHYHREMRKFLGDAPKVSDLAYLRTAIPENTIIPKLKCEGEIKTPKFKAASKIPSDKKDPTSGDSGTEYSPATPTTPVKSEIDSKVNLQDSPKLRNALENQVVIKRPKVLYPVKKEVKSEQVLQHPEFSSTIKDEMSFVKLLRLPENELKYKPEPILEPLDFEAAISTHTVTKPPTFWKRKSKNAKKPKAEGEAKDKKKKSKKKASEWIQEFDGWESSEVPQTDFGTPNLNFGTPQLKTEDTNVNVESPSTSVMQEMAKQDSEFMISETGEKIKIVHMKREEIINCHCGFGEEDGLMIQCDLCLCWQHAICHNYDTNTVPDKYTCSICLKPRRGRASRRFAHDQAWLYEGLLPGGQPDDTLRRAHELTGNLLRLTHVLHTLRLKLHVATKKDHPKLYLWAKDWETSDVKCPDKIEPLNHVDLNDMFREIGKENLPLKDMSMDDKSSLAMEVDGQGEGNVGSQVLLANLLSSPGGASLELPISTSELERLAKSVQEAEAMRSGPEPEAAIESSACRKNLLSHIQRLQALIDAKLDSIEAQVAELESQEQSFEDDETAEFFPRTKQTIQMLYRDLDTLEEIGIIT